MPERPPKIRVLIERGDKRFFATALDWPGWARGGKSRDEALARLIEYGARYRKSVGTAARELVVPNTGDDLEEIAIADRNKNVDFGVPHSVVEPDRESLATHDLERQIALLRAAWTAFGLAASGARAKELASGARGGGRSLDKIIGHVFEAERMYISALGAKPPPSSASRTNVETAFVEGIHSKLRGELPEKGPRGGDRWPARYAIRRSAWHSLDHAWEIEDRTER